MFRGGRETYSDMKKAILATAFVALALGAAQAITAGWDRGWLNLTGGAPGVGTQYAGNFIGATGVQGSTSSASIWNNTQGTYAAIFYTGATLGSGTVLSTGSNNLGKNNQFTLGISEGQWTVALHGLNNSSVSYVDGANLAVKANTQYILGFSIVRGDGTATVEISVNGTAIATATGTCSGPIGSWAWGQRVAADGAGWGLDAYTEDARYEVFVLPAEVENATALAAADLAAEIALLPEPTALALLALGVAGVALRRRAA